VLYLAYPIAYTSWKHQPVIPLETVTYPVASFFWNVHCLLYPQYHYHFSPFINSHFAHQDLVEVSTLPSFVFAEHFQLCLQGLCLITNIKGDDGCSNNNSKNYHLLLSARHSFMSLNTISHFILRHASLIKIDRYYGPCFTDQKLRLNALRRYSQN
jgi:hypothetical protein